MSLKNMARPEGFEPPTLCLEGRRSFQTELRAHSLDFKATTLECQNDLEHVSVRRLAVPGCENLISIYSGCCDIVLFRESHLS
jgi:hypothetical protein